MMPTYVADSNKDTGLLCPDKHVAPPKGLLGAWNDISLSAQYR